MNSCQCLFVALWGRRSSDPNWPEVPVEAKHSGRRLAWERRKLNSRRILLVGTRRKGKESWQQKIIHHIEKGLHLCHYFSGTVLINSWVLWIIRSGQQESLYKILQKNTSFRRSEDVWPSIGNLRESSTNQARAALGARNFPQHGPKRDPKEMLWFNNILQVSPGDRCILERVSRVCTIGEAWNMQQEDLQSWRDLQSWSLYQLSGWWL